MRWWGSKPQSVTAKSLDYVADCYVYYLALPAIIIPAIATTRVHPPTWASPRLRPSISVCHTRSFAHLGVSRIRPSMPTTHPILHIPYGSGSYCTPISPPILILPLASHESARVARSCFSVASWRHHAPLLRPPTLYPVSLVHNSNGGRSATHCATVACRLSMQILVDWVPAASCTPSASGVSHVPYHNHLDHFSVISQRNSVCVPSTLFTIDAKRTHVSDPYNIIACTTAL